MKKDISVDRAVSIGNKFINLPIMLILSSLTLISYLLTEKFKISQWYILLGFIIGFLCSWLYWSFAITKWRIWAYTNVRNVHELNKKAIQNKLIWSNNFKFFEKTEIRTKNDKKKLEELSLKFESKDIFFEDLTLPKVSYIYNSKSQSITTIIISIIVIAIGIYSVFMGTNKGNFLGSILIFVAIKYGYSACKIFFDKVPQIIIDSEGIKTKKTPKKSWDEVSSAKIVRNEYKNHDSYCLIISLVDDNYEKIALDSLDVSAQNLENMIRTYRMRFYDISTLEENNY